MNSNENLKRLQELAGPGITITEAADVSKLLNGSVFSAEVHIGRLSGTLSLPKDVGFEQERLSDNGKKAFKENLIAGRLCILNDDQRKKLGRIDTAARNIVKNNAIGGFIPLSLYDGLKDAFDSLRKEYFDTVYEVYTTWDDQVSEFQVNLEEMFEGAISISEKRKDEIYRSLVNLIPSKGDWKDSCYMNMTVRAYPAVSGSEGLSSSIAHEIDQTFENESIKAAILAAEQLIGKGWSVIGSALRSFFGHEKDGRWENGTGSFRANTIQAIVNYGNMLKKANILNNVFLSDLSKRISDIRFFETEDQAELLSEVFVKIYQYADENMIALDMSICPWSKSVMNDRVLLLGL